MSIDPKKGGKCWSCKHCEDIATQTHNEQGSYYRKCRYLLSEPLWLDEMDDRADAAGYVCCG